MRLKHLMISILCIVVVSCKTDTKSSDIEINTDVKSSYKITKKEIEALKFNDYLLSNEASNAVVDWQKYQELNTQIEYLKEADLSFFKSDITLITAFITDFKAELPQSLVTNAINARITALETKMLKLNSLLLLDNIAKDKKLEALREVFIAFSNLNLQINKKLEFEANNILKPE